MANQLNIRGVIVGSEFDSAFFADYIGKGIITPESKFRAALAGVDAKQPLDLYINSPGGSVFAGNEMANALLDWKKATGQKVHVTLGAMAASMGAVLPVQVADSVSAHQNSKIMFHGASSIAIGGAGAMKDSAELLGKVNADIQTALVSRYGVNPDEAASWFAEGREKWLTAEDAKKIGLVQNIIGSNAAPTKATAAQVRELSAKGIGISAVADAVEIEIETEDDGEACAKCSGSGQIDGADCPDCKGTGTMPTESTEPEAEPNKEEINPAASAAGGILAKPSDFEAQLEARENLILQLRGSCDALTAEVGTIKAQLATVQASLAAEQSAHKGTQTLADTYKGRLNKLLAGGLKYQPEGSIESWDQLVAKLGYVEARKQHPTIFASWMKAKGVNLKN